MQTETMLWLCNFKQKKKKISVVLKQRNINNKTNSPDSSLSVDLYRLQSNVSHRHRLQSHDSHRHRLQSHDFQFILSGSSTKKKFSRPETLAGERDPTPDPELEKLLENSIDCDVDMDSGRHAKIQLSPNQRA
ncbi:hypothetical protein D6D26_05789 [Aureobasidium pullulans]|nr:hypothetical protein D6D26_05789 [Aureobasidium pullulans]